MMMTRSALSAAASSRAFCSAAINPALRALRALARFRVRRRTEPSRRERTNGSLAGAFMFKPLVLLGKRFAVVFDFFEYGVGVGYLPSRYPDQTLDRCILYRFDGCSIAKSGIIIPHHESAAKSGLSSPCLLTDPVSPRISPRSFPQRIYSHE